ncbi:hypothetical protein BCV70DRAFT_200095 [Testicularia cyperi]|uniref:PXA domain-containing protein n=1 Tax=Testicularia cyperi TaxID=1882483 RepID=A0A317XTZ2_9BASI|nr:hypothetical protein BCV70DRAFT_200095 [Testicularia cyperi]
MEQSRPADERAPTTGSASAAKPDLFDTRNDSFSSPPTQHKEPDATAASLSPESGSAESSATTSAATSGAGQPLYYALVAALSAALLRAGFFNSLLVVAVAALLLCNPWVRLLLELPSTTTTTTTTTKSVFGRFDPARYLLSSPPDSIGVQNGEYSDGNKAETHGSAFADDLQSHDGLLDLAMMPETLCQNSQRLIRLVVRDFVQNWYDNVSFAHPNFPISAEANVSHLTSSVYLRTHIASSSTVAAELLLTVQSIVLASLRRRRTMDRHAARPGSPASPYHLHASLTSSTWPNTAARIDALRKAVRKFLARNLPPSERSSPVVMLLLTEILAKQTWQIIQNISDPDFINQKIVQLAEPASQTSLEAKTISPDELQDLKKLAASTVSEQPPGMQMPAVPALSHHAQAHMASDSMDNLDKYPSLIPSTRSSTLASTSTTTTSPASTTGFGQTPARTSTPSTSYSARTLAAGLPGRPTPPPKSSSPNPLAALGGFASGALGALAGAAERAVDVVGDTVDEFGNMLIVPADPNARNRGRTSPRNRKAAHDSAHLDSSAPIDRPDMPYMFDQPELPVSVRDSVRREDGAQSNGGKAALAGLSHPRNGAGIMGPPDGVQKESWVRNPVAQVAAAAARDGPTILAPKPIPAPLSLAPEDTFEIEAEQEPFADDDDNEQAQEATAEQQPDATVAMQQLLSQRDTPAYESFEAFLESSTNPFCARHEGEALLRLHTQLSTLADIAEFTSLDERTFRADASGILTKGLERLPSTLPPTHDGSPPVLVRRSAQQVLTNLEWCANMDVVEPLREQILHRFVQLHAAFAAGSQKPPVVTGTGTRHDTSEAATLPRSNSDATPASLPLQHTPSPTKSRQIPAAEVWRTDSPEPYVGRPASKSEARPSTESHRPSIAYEPRKKTSAPPAPGGAVPATPTSPLRRSVDLVSEPGLGRRGTPSRLATDDVFHASPIPESMSGNTSTFASRSTTPAPKPMSELSSKDLDMILASIFAVADEAFNLQGGWTLRRGMLRVLEQVVRTTYASSVVSTFNNAAAALNTDNFARWIGEITNSFWPDGRFTTERGPERSDAEKRKTADRAREIIISYAPAQAGFMLGPGGRLACVKALAAVHETVLDPVTASDLGLSLVLKSFEVASR